MGFEKREQAAVHSGVSGLDDIPRGGFPKGRPDLISGTPRAGKTPPAIQILLAGGRRGESRLSITLSETAREIEFVVASRGWGLSGIHRHEPVVLDSVVEKRSGQHESTIRELHAGGTGVIPGEPLRDFRGVLTGIPIYVGDQELPSMKADHA